jgi:hypothetical protein
MSGDGQTFGGRLYSELRQLSGYDLITGIMDYKAIQQLKVSDRDDTLKLFRGSSYEVIQLLKTGEPEDAARYIVAKAEEAKKEDTDCGEAMLVIMITCM